MDKSKVAHFLLTHPVYVDYKYVKYCCLDFCVVKFVDYLLLFFFVVSTNTIDCLE